ncbi:putative endonuclease [Pontibacter ummariensis]|uniref:Putative endonuclease n=1 Tax=Pontibacter ummariensis TaxID=1610492 RepID=A0A239BTQ0_9BACT|nr:hypothetical protein [Pontibacter ummariensis]PRY15625.1 putative endonuclease [Pontibacter ummariensis]SNS11286.1 putative endonuclease [Pontibacter ummariensis]
MERNKAHYFVYIYGNKPSGDVQVGVAGNLVQLTQEKHAALVDGSGAVHAGVGPRDQKLVYYEHYDREEVARNRERQIKEGGQDSAYRLIDSMNPNWLDLSDTL